MFLLDDINRDLLDLLQLEGRMSYKDLGDRIGLTAPAVAERIRKLEDAGVITGYRAVVDYEAIGFPILSIIRLKAPMRSEGIDPKIAAIPNVIEASRVTGSDSHVIRGTTAPDARSRRAAARRVGAGRHDHECRHELPCPASSDELGGNQRRTRRWVRALGEGVG